MWVFQQWSVLNFLTRDLFSGTKTRRDARNWPRQNSVRFTNGRNSSLSTRTKNKQKLTRCHSWHPRSLYKIGSKLYKHINRPIDEKPIIYKIWKFYIFVTGFHCKHCIDSVYSNLHVWNDEVDILILKFSFYPSFALKMLL